MIRFRKETLLRVIGEKRDMGAFRIGIPHHYFKQGRGCKGWD
jgi:hypothetical protein